MDDRTSSQKIKRYFFGVLQLVLALLALGLAMWQIGKYTSSLTFDISSQWPNIASALVMYIAFYGVLAIHWGYVSNLIDSSNARHQWLAFFASQPYKYLPSSIFTLTFRAKYAKQLGMSYKKSSIAQFVENYSMLASATVVMAAGWLVLHVHIAAAALVAILGAGIFVLSLHFIKKLPVAPNQAIRIFILSSFAWCVAGLGFFLLDSSLGFISALTANSTAFAAGIAAIFAPGGLGVRELIYGIFTVTASTIVMWRLLTAVVDIVVGVTAWTLIRKL